VKTLDSATDTDALVSSEAYVLKLLWGAQSGRRFVLQRVWKANREASCRGGSSRSRDEFFATDCSVCKGRLFSYS
jgi:hypothetical protein